jgi:hypothetical protein
VSGLTYDVAVQLDRAYRTMAERARYRPAAPSDGFGHINGPLNISRESREYALSWARDEDRLVFQIGCCNYPTREATVYLVEAARALCGADDGLARDPVRLAAEALDMEAVPQP